MWTAPYDILTRSRFFALRIIKVYAALPATIPAQVLGKRLLRSATSVGAHIREAKHSRSRAEMLGKIDVALQELEESRYWLELLTDAGILQESKSSGIKGEAKELLAILFTSMKTLKGNKPRP